MTLTIKRGCIGVHKAHWLQPPTDCAKIEITFPKGKLVEYMGHVVGGMISVRSEGEEWIINPGATEELG